MKSSPARIVSVAVLSGALLLLWACYPAAEASYAQDTVTRQWLIEYRPAETKLQVGAVMRSRRKPMRPDCNDVGTWGVRSIEERGRTE